MSVTDPNIYSSSSVFTKETCTFPRLFYSVSDPYSLNPDPVKNLNPDPGKFFSLTKNLLEIEEKKNVVHKTIKKN